MKRLLVFSVVCLVVLLGCKRGVEVGCTDPLANNYNPNASYDDGTCEGICLGCLYQGGVVFYLDGNGGGLIASTYDQAGTAYSTGQAPPVVEWGCDSTDILGADGTVIGTGAQNTLDIINANCSPEESGNIIAVDPCANFTSEGYNDWFLPSKDELNLMYEAFSQGILTGYYEDYFSSSEIDDVNVWSQSFIDGEQFSMRKSNINGGGGSYGRVRAIRAF